MVAVVRPEHDEGIVCPTTCLQCLDEIADEAVDEAGAGQVRSHQVFQLPGLFHEFEARFGEFPVKVPGETRCVLPIVAQDGWKD